MLITDRTFLTWKAAAHVMSQMKNISIWAGHHLRKLIPLHEGQALLPTCWIAELLFLQLHLEVVWDKWKGLFRSANVSHGKPTYGSTNGEPEEMHLPFLRSGRLFLSGYWYSVAKENLCQTYQCVQWTCQRASLREARTRASTWLNRSSINLGIVSAVVLCYTQQLLLWYVWICFWLNTLIYFMYPSPLHLRLIYTTHPNN